MNKLYFIPILFIGFFAMSLQAANSPLKSELKVYKVIEQDGKESLDSAQEARPGDVLQYAISYKNIGKVPLSELAVIGPIPEGTAYQKGTQMTQSSAVFEASADKGVNWSAPPLYRQVVRPDGSIEQQLIPESQYTEIRWKLKSPLLPGQEADFVYRVKLREG